MPRLVLTAVALMICSVVAIAWYYFTPEYVRVGYRPLQPVSFSHNVHAGQLGMDCRYCHAGVERSWYANIPHAVVCMNCHNQVLIDDPRLDTVRKSVESGKPIQWTRVHRSPDYVFFNHAVHVNRGIGCVECHGQVNRMDATTHARSLSMASCLACHRNPVPFLRPLDQVYNLDWQPADSRQSNTDPHKLVSDRGIRTSVYCSTCHR